PQLLAYRCVRDWDPGGGGFSASGCSELANAVRRETDRRRWSPSVSSPDGRRGRTWPFGWLQPTMVRVAGVSLQADCPVMTGDCWHPGSCERHHDDAQGLRACCWSPCWPSRIGSFGETKAKLVGGTELRHSTLTRH